MASQTITLTKRGVEKSGNVAYSREGVRASVYFNKNMFTGEPPESIEITADAEFTVPGAIKPKVVSAEALEKAKAAAEKAKVAAEKAAARAAKALERASKLSASTPAAN